MFALARVVALGDCHCQGPWASGAEDVAGYQLECAFGENTFGDLVQWDFPVGIERELLFPTMSQHPDVWSHGSRVTREVAKFKCAGSGVFAGLSGEAWLQWEWGQWISCLRGWKMLWRSVVVVFCSWSSADFGCYSGALGCCCYGTCWRG